MNAKGSKSAPTKKTAKTPAQGGPPEVTMENGTTVVLPNPADAPAPPPKPMRRSSRDPKTAPTIATKAATAAPVTEVPAWAKRAAATNLAAEMAAVPEVGEKAEPAAETRAAKKGAPKAAKATEPTPKKATAKEMPTAKPGSLRAIGNAWIESIRAAGHSKSTVSSYANDLEVAYEFLDGNTAAAVLTEKQIAAFNESKAVLKKANGKPKAKPTILKTRRALRLALVWAAQTKLIAKAPYTAA